MARVGIVVDMSWTGGQCERRCSKKLATMVPQAVWSRAARSARLKPTDPVPRKAPYWRRSLAPDLMPLEIIIGAILVLVVVTCGVVLSARQSRREKQAAADLRLAWRKKIEGLADDLTPSPDGCSLDMILECLEEPDWDDICHELERMPPGQRSLKKVVEITGREGYERSD